MKRIIFATLFTSLLSLCAHAQIENKMDSISMILEQESLELSPSRITASDLDAEKSVENMESENKIDAAEWKRRADFVSNLLFLMPKTYKGSVAEESIIGRTMPEFGEYAYFQYMELSDNLSFNTASSQRNYHTVGSNRMIRFNINYQVTDWFSMSGGVYGAKYNMVGFSPTTGPGIVHYNDGGFNTSLRFKLHDRVYLRAHGQYSINSFDRNRNFGPVTQGMFPQTYYGAGMEFKVTDKIGIEGGMVRELNPMTGKWTNTPYIMPIFYPLGKR